MISRLAARIKSFETAFGMQFEMPAALDLSGKATRPWRSTVCRAVAVKDSPGSAWSRAGSSSAASGLWS